MKSITGIQDQRYEIRFIDDDGKERIAGWTSDPSGGALVKSINLHPAWHSPKIIDRKKDNNGILHTNIK